MDLKISCNHQKLSLLNKSKPVADSVDYLTLSFSFSTDWDGTAKTAVFTHGDNTYTQLLDSDSIIVPHEVIASPGFDLSVYGSVGTKRITADVINIPVSVSGYKDGQTPEPPTPTVYDQIISLCGDARNTAQSVRDDADNGKFTPKRGVDYWTDSDKTEIVDDVLAADEIQQLSVNEAERITAENERQNAETARTDAEADRQKNEKTRVKSETERASAENNRQLNESARSGAETKRQTAEESRASAEAERQSDEAVRAGAENTRISAENERAAAETARVTAENERKSAEAVRQENEAKRQEAYNGKADIIILESQTAKTQIINEAVDYPIEGLNIYGNSDQDGAPTPTAPVDIVSAQPTVTISHLTKSQSFSVPEYYPLRALTCSAGTIYDEFYLKDGKVWYVQRLYYGPMPAVSKITTTAIGKFVSKFEPSIDPDIIAGTATDIFMCTHFAQGGSGSERIYLHNGRGRMQLTTSLTVNDINNLSNCYIMYPIAPITTEITDSGIVSAVKALSTYLGSTKITCDNLCKIKYRADTTAAYNNLLKKINELQSAVITLGGTI